MFATDVYLKIPTTGEGICIFVTIYQRNILLLRVYIFLKNKMLMLAVFFMWFPPVCFVLFRHCFKGARGPKWERSSQHVYKGEHWEAVPRLSECLYHCQLLGERKKKSNLWFFSPFPPQSKYSDQGGMLVRLKGLLQMSNRNISMHINTHVIVPVTRMSMFCFVFFLSKWDIYKR